MVNKQETNESIHQSSVPSGIYWPKDQQLPTFKEPERLDVVDVVGEPGDIKLLLATLQGIVNRKKPRIYLLENVEEGKYTWLKDLNVPYTEMNDYKDMIQKYKKEILGMIIYDPEVMDSVNVATTLAGIKQAVVVSPALADVLQEEPFQLKVIEDFQGKFTDKLHAYRWQLENLWSQVSKRLIVGLSPGISKRNVIDLPDSFTVIAEDKTGVTDGRNRDVYTFDLTKYFKGDDLFLRFDDAFPNDGYGPAVHRVVLKADGNVIADIKANTSDEDFALFDRQQSQIANGPEVHRFADHDRYFVYRFTPPKETKELIVEIDMWNQYKVSVSDKEPETSEAIEPYGYLRDYAVANQAGVFWLDANGPDEKELLDEILTELKPGTPYFGWFADDIKGEFGGVEYVSWFGVYVVPADWFNNLTVFSGTKRTSTPIKTSPIKPLENKIYVTMMFGEGDNFQYNQHRMRMMWEDEKRGKVPLNWTSSPLLYNGAPVILEYFQRTATENDLLVTGPSGVGYFYADPWPEAHFVAFLKDTYPYMKKTGMEVTYVLNRIGGQNVPLSEIKAKAYEKHYQVTGLLLSWEDNIGVHISHETLPISTIRGIGSIQEGRDVLKQAKANWDGSSPLFISLGLLAWNLMPSDIVEMTKFLDEDYEIVLADQYIDLIRKAYGLDE